MGQCLKPARKVAYAIFTAWEVGLAMNQAFNRARATVASLPAQLRITHVDEDDHKKWQMNFGVCNGMTATDATRILIQKADLNAPVPRNAVWADAEKGDWGTKIGDI